MIDKCRLEPLIYIYIYHTDVYEKMTISRMYVST